MSRSARCEGEVEGRSRGSLPTPVPVTSGCPVSPPDLPPAVAAGWAPYDALGVAEAGLTQSDPLPPQAMPAAHHPHPHPHPHAHAHEHDQAHARHHPQLAAAGVAYSARHRDRGALGVSDDAPSQLASLAHRAAPLKEEAQAGSKCQVHMGHEMMAGSLASVVSRFCVAPLDVLKIRFQIQEHASHRQYTSVLQAFQSIYRQEGIMAFWKGNAAAELMVLPYGAVSFLAYSKCKSWFPVVENSQSSYASYQHLSSLAAGSFAGLCATVSTYPLDLLRTRFAAQQQHRIYSSLAHAARHIIEREGVGGLYTGLAPTLIGIVPLMALQFGTYEAFKQAIRNAKADPGVDPNTLQLSFMEQSGAGFSAGVISKFLTMPLDVIKKRFQVSSFELPQVMATAQQENSKPPPHMSAKVATKAAQAIHSAPIIPAASMPAHSASVLTHRGPAAFGSTVAGPHAHTPIGAAFAHPASQLPKTHSPSPAAPATLKKPAGPLSLSAEAIAAGTAASEAAAAPAPAAAASAPRPLHAFFTSLRRVLTLRPRGHEHPVAGRRPFSGVLDCARGIVAHEGWTGLFKGSVPSILKAGPNSAIIYLVYEYSIRWFNRNAENGNGNGNGKANGNHKFQQ